MDLSNQKFFKKDFSGQDLKIANLSHSEFICCNFDNADLREADCSHSQFRGSTFKDANCRGTNFAKAKLNGTIFKPIDCYGMTLTLECSTFRGMLVSNMWWYCWQQFSLLMKPDADADGKDPKDSLIASIGISKYLALKRMFQEREI